MDLLIRGGRHQRLAQTNTAANRERPKSEPNNIERSHSDTNLIDQPASKNDWLELYRTNSFEDNDDNIISGRSALPEEVKKPTRKFAKPESTSDERTPAPLANNEIIASNDRLTMLEEPVVRQASHGALSISPTRSLEANKSRETMQQRADNHIIWSAPEQNNSNINQRQETNFRLAASDQQTLLNPANVASNQQLLILTFFGGIASFLLFLLLALILYNWFFSKRKRRQVNGKWWSARWPIFRIDKSHQHVPTCEDSPGKMSSNLVEDFGCVSGERVQLVERRPIIKDGEKAVRNQGEAAGEHLLSSSPVDDEHEIISEICLETGFEGKTERNAARSRTDEKRSSTMVILKRRLAKNSFFLSGRPKVRLIGECMRKFIDDEAKEMHARKRTTVPAAAALSWRDRLPIYLGGSRKGTDNQEADVRELAYDTDPTTNKCEQDENRIATGGSVELDGSTESMSERMSKQGDAGVEAADEQAGDYSNEAPATTSSSSQQQDLGQKQLLGLGEQAKYLQSPTILNDTCSSTSLFTPSPVVAADSSNQASQTNSSSPWPCNPLDWQQLQSRTAQKDLFGIRNECSDINDCLRSKSHENTPIQCYNSSSGAQVCRPCCASASPSVLNQQRDSPEQICCQQQQQLTYQATSNYNQKPRVIDHMQLGTNPTSYPNPNHLQSSAVSDKYSLNGFRSLSNHLRRQYENYYDDEQGDAYRRLTANIGMDFDMGYDHRHHHHHSINALNYCNVKDAAHLNGLLHMAPGCEAAACSQHLQPGQLGEQHPLLVPPSLGVHQANALADQIHPQPQRFPPRSHQETCLCCQPRNPTSYASNPMSVAQTCDVPDRSPFYHGQRQRSCSDQQQMPVPNTAGYLFKDGGSAGELLTSSASTSLGGSDSGFMASSQVISNNMRQPAICSNPLCACQVGGSALAAQMPQKSQQVGGPPMSILIQQPSIATPPPSHQSIDIDAGSLTSDKTRLNLAGKPTAASGDNNAKQDGDRQVVQSDSSSNSFIKNSHGSLGVIGSGPLPSGSKSTSPTTIRPRWKHRRNQLNQRQRTDLGSYGVSHSSNLILRRVSIAGDQLSVRAMPSPINLRDTPPSPVPNQQQQSTLFQHRASVASEGGWLQEYHASNTHQLRFNPNQHPPYHHHSFNQHHRHSEVPQIDHSHRPSDASLYDSQSCAVKSNYSSSGGSSSGIGISGSTCATNTPTTASFPYSSFATNFKIDQFANDELATRLNLSSAQAAVLCSSYPMQHFANNPYQPDIGQMAIAQKLITDSSTPPNGYQMASCASRKYSLPVQLESQSSERLSPTHRANRLLFEKNLQRVDSVNLSSSQQSHRLHGLQSGRTLPGSVVAAHPGGQQQLENYGQRSEQRRLFESRRSSQTITRQSSFWLEDDSADSIFSLATSGIAGLQSDDGSQMDVNNLQLEERDGHDRPTAEPDEPTQRRSSHQRPSLSSLVTSGDSIESVKQRPTTISAAANEANEPNNSMPATDGAPQMDLGGGSRMNTSSQSKQSGATEKRSSQPSKAGIAHLRNRLSSSSITSSTTSSPSPDSSRPSDRVLGIAPKSSSISKRHTYGKLRTGRRHSRLASCSGTNNDANRSDGTRRAKALEDPSFTDLKPDYNKKCDGDFNDGTFASKYPCFFNATPIELQMLNH